MFPKLLFWLMAAVGGPYSASGNFAADLLGPIDTRPGTWGNAEAVTWVMEFFPPVGARVRVLEIDGDLVAWPKILPGQTPAPAGSYAGVAVGFLTDGPPASSRCSYCADVCLLCAQAALDARPVTRVLGPRAIAPASGVLPDNKLEIEVSAWLNTTGYAIHIEPTFNVTYVFEGGDAGGETKRPLLRRKKP